MFAAGRCPPSVRPCRVPPPSPRCFCQAGARPSTPAASCGGGSGCAPRCYRRIPPPPPPTRLPPGAGSAAATWRPGPGRAIAVARSPPDGAGPAPAERDPRCPRGGAGLGCPGTARLGSRTAGPRSARPAPAPAPAPVPVPVPVPVPAAHGERGPAAARQQEAAGRLPRRPRSPLARRGMPGPRMPAWGILPVTLPAFTITGMWIV